MREEIDMRWTTPLITTRAIARVVVALMAIAASPLGEIVAFGYRWT
jgi:hypothetical protein